MKSIKELYKIGYGPSSSHTMGPEKAIKLFDKEFGYADKYVVTLYGSLALTGEGHCTDKVLKKSVNKPVHIIWNYDIVDLPHPNTLDIVAIKDGAEIGFWRVYSIGGGAIKIEGMPSYESDDVYKENSFESIRAYCEQNNLTIPQYVEKFEGEGIWDYLAEVWKCMHNSIDSGLVADGVLPGGLETKRKAKILYNGTDSEENSETREDRILCSYAFAVSEENASGNMIVTAPTCGASGVLPACLKYVSERRNLSERAVLEALATAGIMGNLIKTNASISGAECGCQAEIGSACSMSAAAVAEMYHMSLDQIEYAAEIAMEHHLGLTCDPINGLVQIPCIERNAVAAMRALNAVSLARFLTNTRKISFDTVIHTMYQTGKDLRKEYRETSEGGLAKTFKNKKR